MKISGNIVDVVNRKIFTGIIHVEDGKIKDISEEKFESDKYIIPGFIDSHVHIESSMLLPYEFGRIAATHGTVSCICDPHEIANVMGLKGVEFMIENSRQSPIKIYFGAPSCVPATGFETAGGEIDINDIWYLFEKHDLKFLSEVMNVPGVIYNDPDVVEKINLAKSLGRKIDGHAPRLKGESLKKYVDAGIGTDHECTDINEAIEKIKLGMKVQIRNGSAAKDFDELFELIDMYPENCMFCTDDLHPDNLVNGHINLIVKEAVSRGADLFNVLQIACVNPVRHYGLCTGTLQVGDNADFLIVSDLKNFEVLRTYVNGKVVAKNGVADCKHQEFDKINNFAKYMVSESEFKVYSEIPNDVNVIVINDGSLVTEREKVKLRPQNGNLSADVENDILKIAVVNRYKKSKPSVGFVKNFGIKRGAVASSVAHDSHNIVAVGCDDFSLCRVVNIVMENEGGVAVVDGGEQLILPLPFGGVMSGEEGYRVSNQYRLLDEKVKKMGSPLMSPFMTLSFLALLVIPSLKISDKGLFDSEDFKFISVLE
jgi:adenine deaminase